MGSTKVPKTKSVAAAKNKYVSEEFVHSSDEDSNDEGRKEEKVNAPSKKSKKTKPSRSAPEETPIPLPSISSSAKPSRSQSKVSSSHEKIAAKPNSVKPSKKTVPPAPTVSKKKRKTPTPPPEEIGSDESSGASSADESDSGSEENKSVESSRNEGHHPPTKTTNGAAQGAAPQQPLRNVSRTMRSYVPPTGYSAIDMDQVTRTSAVQSLAELGDLSGKKVYHIVAPSKVPLAELEKLHLEKISKGVPVITHESTDYGLLEQDDQVSKETAILLPQSSGYALVKARLHGTIQLQQLVKLPHLSEKAASTATGSEAAASYSARAPRAVRQQPKGLRMRFQMSGYGQNDQEPLNWSDSDEDGTGETNTMNGTGTKEQSKKKRSKPSGLDLLAESQDTASKQSKKRKQDDTEGQKRKKKKKEKESKH